MDHDSANLFILSSGGHDELCELAMQMGWRCSFETRVDRAEGKFLLDTARIALVDVRHAKDAPKMIAALGPVAESLGGALIVVADRSGAGNIRSWIDAGATHCLLAPFDEDDLRAVVESAREWVRRLAMVARVDSDRQGKYLAEQTHAHEVDYLTGLANRRAALDWLTHALAQGASPVCLLIGISQYDTVNAAYGEIAGDAILARVARRIQQAGHDLHGREDLVARVAGTEFLIALRSDIEGEERGAERALLLARHIVQDMAKPFVAGDSQIRLTARCGIAEGLAADDAARLLRRASAALADARRSGTGDICLRTTDRRGRGLDLDKLDADLRLALDRGEIGVVFQPQYDAQSDRIVGVEALARWNHAQLGQLGAKMLFDAAERSDYLLPLSRHIQQEALQQAACWPDALRALRLSINVTAADLAQRNFVTQFLAMVHASGFPADRLTVEITESGLIENIDKAAQILGQLRGQGMRVAMDDFGTGYSSLAYLKALHLDYLKIDSGLTRDITAAPRDRIIVRGIIAMAKSLSLSVVAEGVENETQLSLLAREGCDIYQGFLRSAGVDSETLAGMVVAAV